MAYLYNDIPAQAYKGQAVKITLSNSYISQLPNIILGEIMENSDGKLGIVCEIDSFGNSFKISPLQPNFRFDSDATPGILGDVAVQPYTP